MDFRLDDSRSAQQHRDLLELEYDRAELEDWSFSLSTEDLAQNESAIWKEQPATTNTPALPAIKEHNLLELEEDANECLWNGASYLADRTGGELVRFFDRCLNNYSSKEFFIKFPNVRKRDTTNLP